jgi:hypothetical protein
MGGWFQRTFRTPLEKLPAFTEAILKPHVPFTLGTVTIDAVVFAPPHLEKLLAKHTLPLEWEQDRTITAFGHDEIMELLQATLADWINFFFVPTPKAFMIYADHDEYMTIFAARKGGVSRTAESLLSSGFEEVVDWERHLPPR